MRCFVNEDWSEMIIEQETQTIIISQSGGEIDYLSRQYPVIMDKGFKEIDNDEAIMWKDTVMLRLNRNIQRIDKAFAND